MEMMITRSSITTEAALVAARAALEKAEELGISVSVAVVDAGGQPLAFMRHNAASFHSVKIAWDKAYTAVSFKMPTGPLGKFLYSLAPEISGGLAQCDRLAAFGGGVEITFGDNVAGGIGVSGGSAEEDEECALAGTLAFKKNAAS